MLTAHRLVDQGRRHGGVHAAAQGADHLAAAHLLPDASYLLPGERVERPGSSAAADGEQEVPEDARPRAGVRHLGMELQPVPAPVGVFNRGDRLVRHRRHLKTRRQPTDVVAVGHPDDGLFGDSVQQGGRADPPDCGPAVLPAGALPHLAAEQSGGELETVADAQHGHSQLEHAGVADGAVRVEHRHGPAGQHDAAQRALPNRIQRDVEGHDLAVDTALADPAGDQLGILGTEIQDQDFVAWLHVIAPGGWRSATVGAATGRRPDTCDRWWPAVQCILTNPTGNYQIGSGELSGYRPNLNHRSHKQRKLEGR